MRMFLIKKKEYMGYLMFMFLNSLLFSKQTYAQARLEDRLRRVMDSGTGTGEAAFADFVQQFLEFAVPLGVFAAFVLLGYAAFIMITSAGDQEKLREAREVATNAVIGAVMIAMGVIVLSILATELEIPGL